MQPILEILCKQCMVKGSERKAKGQSADGEGEAGIGRAEGTIG